jgi:hypothetical protein
MISTVYGFFIFKKSISFVVFRFVIFLTICVLLADIYPKLLRIRWNSGRTSVYHACLCAIDFTFCVVRFYDSFRVADRSGHGCEHQELVTNEEDNRSEQVSGLPIG